MASGWKSNSPRWAQATLLFSTNIWKKTANTMALFLWTSRPMTYVYIAVVIGSNPIAPTTTIIRKRRRESTSRKVRALFLARRVIFHWAGGDILLPLLCAPPFCHKQQQNRRVLSFCCFVLRSATNPIYIQCHAAAGAVCSNPYRTWQRR